VLVVRNKKDTRRAGVESQLALIHGLGLVPIVHDRVHSERAPQTCHGFLLRAAGPDRGAIEPGGLFERVGPALHILDHFLRRDVPTMQLFAR